MIDKATAIRLRLEGYKYDHIATALNCSVAWCKKNLKGIRPNHLATVQDKNSICNNILTLVESLRAL